MTEAETAKIILMLREYYPRDIESTTIRAKVKAWHIVLQDYSFEVAQAAVVSFVANDRKGFMPTPGQLREQIQTLTAKNELTAQEAWKLVSRAVAKADLMDPSEQFLQLPAEVQQAVGSANMLREWGLVEQSTFNTVIYSNFLRTFEICRRRRKAWEAIPQSIQVAIKGVSDKLALGGGDA